QPRVIRLAIHPEHPFQRSAISARLRHVRSSVTVGSGPCCDGASGARRCTGIRGTADSARARSYPRSLRGAVRLLRRFVSCVELTLDHVEPLRIGGDQSEGNLVTCCRGCNTEKGGEAAWRYLARYPEKRETFLSLATGVWPRLRRAIEEAAALQSRRGS